MSRLCKGGAKEGAAVFHAHETCPEGKGVFDRHRYRSYAPEYPRFTSAKPVCRRYERCRDCPYPRDGFLCWGGDGSCLRTVMRRIYGKREEN